MRTIGRPDDGNLQIADHITSALLSNSATVDVFRNATTASEPWLASLIDQVPELIYVKDVDGRFIFANAAFLANSDIMGAVEWRPGLTDFDYLPEESARKLRDDDIRVMVGGEPIRDIEEQVFLQSGNSHWYSTTKAPLRSSGGEIIGIVGISRNITESKRQDALNLGYASLLEMMVRGQPLEAILNALIRLIESQLENMCGSVLLYDEASKTLYHGAAPGMAASWTRSIDGVTIGPAVGSCGTAAFLLQPVVVADIDNDPLWTDYRQLASEHGLKACWSTPVFGAGGKLLGTFALYAKTVRSPHPREMQLIEMATNIAGIAIDRRRSDEHIQYMAHHDPLTGLSNRNLFWSQLSRSLHEARRENRMVTIAYIDLDNFKQINDSLGHAGGDEVLCAVANRILSHIRASDIAARLGGDEFAIVFSNPVHDEDGMVRRLEEIRKTIALPVVLQNELQSLPTCSIGVAFFPRDGETPETLLARADASMYAAKNTGRNRVHIS